MPSPGRIKTRRIVALLPYVFANLALVLVALAPGADPLLLRTTTAKGIAKKLAKVLDAPFRR